ncbi:MAG: transglutaminase domain-containing protein [Huintestinicola sp.]
MPYKKSFAAALSVILAVTFCGCERKTEYPEDVDMPTVPPAVTTDTVLTIYDTSARTEPVTVPVTTTPTTEKTSPQLATTLTEETEETVSSSESETVTETVPSVTEGTTNLDLSNVPEVGLSEYYEKTQTLPPYAESETGYTGSLTSASLTGSSSETNSDTTETSSETTGGSEVSSLTVSEERSPYSGRNIITRPYSCTSLSEKELALYDKLTSAMLECKSTITFSSSEQITYDELFNTYQLIYNDEYSLFYISPTIEYSLNSNDYIVAMNPRYNYSVSQIKEMKEEIEAAAEKILSAVTPEMSDYEIVKYIHDYVIKSCVYSESADMNSIYGCLVTKKALCQGYAHTFSYLCSRLGIESCTVLGVASEEHMWNMVKMDGDWYHIDLTWDDPDRASFPDSVRYDYFGLTDERIRQLRTVDTLDYPLPAAEGTKYQYYSWNDLVADSKERAIEIIEREVRAANSEKSSTVQFMCSSSQLYDELIDLLFSQGSGNIIDIISPLNDELPNKFKVDTVYHNSNSNTRTIKIYLEYT